MSGGHFNYYQRHIADIIEKLDEVIELNGKPVPEKTSQFDSDYYYDYSPETITKFKEGLYYLNKAQIFAQRIDWLLSSDDGEDTFHKRLAEDLSYYLSGLIQKRSQQDPLEGC